jgi:serine/threonine-protein kinase PknK
VAQAAQLAGESDGELAREAGALARARTDGPQAALAEAEALAADARTDEARARAAGLLGYLTHGLDLERSLREFERAAGAAAAAGAVLEEATYRTGEAAAAVELGYLERGFDGAERATTLWRALGREKEAARAALATAAGFDVLGLDESAERAARAAAELATQGGDVIAAGYAWLAVADATRDPTDARAAVERARGLLRGGDLDAAVRLASRELRMGLDVDESVFEPNAGSLGASALIEWRAAQLSRQGAAAAGSAEAWSAHLDRLVPLARPVAPVGPRARLLANAAECAARHGRPDLAATFGATVAELASVLVARAGARFVEAARRLPWVERGRRSSVHGRAAQARELEELCRALTGRDPMSTILVRAVDALVRWTRVERGLLLLRSPSGELRARAARNLSGGDLSDDQLALSRSLAEKALATGEVVVSLDASSEQAESHQSAHRLRLRSVLAVPLVAHGEALGVAYLDDRARAGAFGEVEIDWARTIASLAATAIADARDRASLARAAERARRAERALADELARREAELSVATAELERARGGRGTRFEYEELVGDSPPMVELLRALDRVAPAHVPVLVTGESGSGKELVARALHRHGPRSQGSFVSENCGAVPEPLLESALFGHARGAFTGADRARTGLFELAHRGTLFLDEIGEMSLGMQAKLLRVLEDGLVRPVGAERARKVDVRLVAATHRDLGAMVKARTFREDLYYRIAVITLRVPPLRERASDIPLLASRLLARHGAAHARITQGALRCLVNHAWPGNVRQLDNELRRAAVLSDGVIDEASLSPEVRSASAPRPAPAAPQGSLHLRERLDELEAQLVREALARSDGNQTKAAALLQVSRFGLQKMMKRLGVVLERGAQPRPTDEGETEPS